MATLWRQHNRPKINNNSNIYQYQQLAKSNLWVVEIKTEALTIIAEIFKQLVAKKDLPMIFSASRELKMLKW